MIFDCVYRRVFGQAVTINSHFRRSGTWHADAHQICMGDLHTRSRLLGCRRRLHKHLTVAFIEI
jgi:hypothetical protein